ncbi:hypothetical protein EMIT0196P_20032 [Pseudomonas chlororaphis]
MPAALCLVLLGVSFLTQNAARELPSPYGQRSAAHLATL